MSGNIDVLKLALEALEPLCVDAELRGDNFAEGNRIHKMADAGFKAIAAIKEALAAPVQDELAYRMAVSLATSLFKKHFAHEERYASGRVVWEPCDTTAGVISQIDSMVCQLVQPAPVQEPVANDWSVFNTGAEVWGGLSLADAVAELTPERLERGWSAVCVINKDNPPVYTTPPAQPAPAQEPVIQRVMARLADLLDEDQFSEIEGMVMSAGYTPPAAPVQRCALCNYQHGHAIGCKNNPVDIALAKLAQPASAQEPRGYQWLDTAIFRKKLPDNAEASAWHPLYTTPTEHKPLFAEMIAEHEGLAEELTAINMGTPVDKLYFPPEEPDGTFVDEGTNMDVEPDGHFLDFAYADSIAQVYVYDQFTKGQPFYSSPPTEKRQWVEVVQVKWEGGKLIAKLKENTT